MAKAAHHTFVQTFARLHSKDRNTEWWTVTNEGALYANRDKIPFTNLFANDGPGGFIIYLNKPRVVMPAAVEALLVAIETGNASDIRVAVTHVRAAYA